MEATASTMAEASTAGTADWRQELLQKAVTFHNSVVETGDSWLDQAAAIDLSHQTRQAAPVTWNEEWNQFISFGSWPAWEFYRQIALDAAHDGWQGIQSVAYWIWLTFQPIIYSVAYMIGRFLHCTAGAALPNIQWALIKFCRVHLHLTWREALGEVAIILGLVAVWKLVRYLRRQQYVQRTKRYLRKTRQRITKSIQRTYRQIAHVSLLLAMSIPHGVYIGVVVAVKVFYPSWVANVSTSTMAPTLLKFWYPVLSTIVVLHHARAFYSDQIKSTDDKKKNNATANKAKSLAKAKDEKTGKKKSRRRRSSLGALLHRTAPGYKSDGLAPGTDEEIVYTEEELNEDVTYWLNFWLLQSILRVTYALVSRSWFVGSIVVGETVHSALCQFELLFYIWIFALPQCLLVLFPSAGEAELRDWPPLKKQFYQIALNPVLAIPSQAQPIIIPFFEKVSQAVPPRLWKKYVVDKAQSVLQLAVLLRMLSEQRKDALVDYLASANTIVIPALTLFTPGFITQYGVLYVEYVVPQAHSFRALARSRRRDQRLLYLKYWVIHAIAAALINWLMAVFWLIPLKTHITFIAWGILVMPRVINSIFHEFGRELQAFGFLPPVADADSLKVENTHTFRAASFVASVIPKAADAEGNTEGDATKETDQAGEKKTRDNAGEAGKDCEPTVLDEDDKQDDSKENNAADSVGNDVKGDEKEDENKSKDISDVLDQPEGKKGSGDVSDGKENQVLSSKAKNKAPSVDDGKGSTDAPATCTKKASGAASTTATEMSDSLRRRSTRQRRRPS